jgi:transmembrane sensor
MGPSTPASSRPPVDWEALARYVTGECPADEWTDVRAWLDAHAGDAMLVAALDRTLGGAAAGRAVDVERALRVVARRRRLIAARDARPAVARAPRRPWRAAAPLAAAAALTVLVAGSLLRPAARGAGEDAATLAAGGAPASTYATAVGRRDSVRLPDGTRVVLGPDSRLVVAAAYGAARREVELRGLAYFDVRHDAARPFTVRAGGAVVRDVGTAFTVRADDDHGAGARVAVTEGTVELRAGGAELLLHRGDVGAVDAEGRLAAQPGALPDDELAWTAGRLVFRDAPIDAVRAELRHWYGVDLRVDDPVLAERRLTATFEGEPAERVLEVIGLALGARLVRLDDDAVAARAAR